jgi:hypothetical protein
MGSAERRSRRSPGLDQEPVDTAPWTPVLVGGLALARALPENGSSSQCVVSGGAPSRLTAR